MAVLSNFSSLVLTYLLLVISSECAGDTCVKKSACKCVFPNGTGIDLSLAAQSKFYDAVYYDDKKPNIIKLSTYGFHPCGDIVLPNHTDLPGDTCQQPMSMYRTVSLLNLTDTAKKSYQLLAPICNYLGNTGILQFNTNDIAISFLNSPSNTTIKLRCADNPGQLVIDSLEDPEAIELTFFSKEACLKQIDPAPVPPPSEDTGRSFGSTLLIVFFSFVIFYLVLGVCTKKFLMGATGVEVIPNLGFWTELPNLVRDGWAFAISGFKLPPRGSPAGPADPNSYDSI